MKRLKKGRARRYRARLLRRRQAVADAIFERFMRPFFDFRLPPHDDEFPVIG